jgi:DNA-binding response OmpR family regulator
LRVPAENAAEVGSHEAIICAVRGDGAINRIGYLRLAIRQLRQKLEPDPVQPRRIITERRVGYRLAVAARWQELGGEMAA